LIDLAEKHQIPVIASIRRQDVFPNNHELYAGHLGLGTHESIIKTIKQADVILALATRLSEVTTQDYSIITQDKKLIHLDIDYDTIGKVYAPDIGLIAAAKEGIQALTEIEVDSEAWQKWALSRHEAYLQ